MKYCLRGQYKKRISVCSPLFVSEHFLSLSRYLNSNQTKPFFVRVHQISHLLLFSFFSSRFIMFVSQNGRSFVAHEDKRLIGVCVFILRGSSSMRLFYCGFYCSLHASSAHCILNFDHRTMVRFEAEPLLRFHLSLKRHTFMPFSYNIWQPLCAGNYLFWNLFSSAKSNRFICKCY